MQLEVVNCLVQINFNYSHSCSFFFLCKKANIYRFGEIKFNHGNPQTNKTKIETIIGKPGNHFLSTKSNTHIQLSNKERNKKGPVAIFHQL